MIVDRKLQDKECERLIYSYVPKGGIISKNDLYLQIQIMQQYAKWHAKQVIDKCAEVATSNVEFAGYGREVQLDASEAWCNIDKQSILKLKNEL